MWLTTVAALPTPESKNALSASNGGAGNWAKRSCGVARADKTAIPSAGVVAAQVSPNSACREATCVLKDAAAARRALIADSDKPSCLIVDFVGNSGRHKLISSIDILGGRYDYEVVARAKEKMKSKGAANGEEASDVSEALETAKREIEAEKAEIERKRKLVLAKAKYVTRAVDPFDRYDLVEAPAADPTMIISPGEERQLRKLLKKKYALTSLTRKQALVNEMRRRRHSGEATLGQEAFLRRRGFVAPMRAGEARRAIDRISRMEGWGW